MLQAARFSFTGARQLLVFALAFTISSLSVISADPIEDWTSILYSPGSGFVGVAAGAGRIVAVDGAGKIISWPKDNPAEKTTHTALAPLRGIAFGNGLFIVVGWEGQVLTSADGQTWVQRASGGTWNFRDVIFGNGAFVAVGSQTLLRSTNGIDWTIPPLPLPDGFPKVFFAGGDFFLSMDRGAFTDRSTNFLSTDAIHWTPIDLGPSENLYSIGYGNGLFIAFNFDNEILTSSDARSWHNRGVLPTVLRPLPVVEGNGYLVTAGGNSRAYSRDGIHWRVITTDKHHGGDLIFHDGTFLVGGYEHIQQSGPIVTLTFDSSALTLSGMPNTQYRIESSDQLSANNNWSLQHTLFTPASGISEPWIDTRPNSASRFYRAVQSDLFAGK